MLQPRTYNIKAFLIFFVFCRVHTFSSEFTDLFTTYKDIETITPDLVVSETVLQNNEYLLALKIQMKGQKLDRYLFYTKQNDGYRFDGDQVTAYPQAFYVLLHQLQSAWTLNQKKLQLLSWMRLSDMKDHELESFFIEKYRIFEQLSSLSNQLDRDIEIQVNTKSETKEELENSDARLLQIYLEDLGLRHATWISKRNCLDLEIGGMNGHRLGFMYCESESNFPKLSRLGFYYIDHLKPGWFFYRRFLTDNEEW
tara:strand:- start:9 stop:770 length:762 start_codon:yes stop_codon:yes gene_type:complete